MLVAPSSEIVDTAAEEENIRQQVDKIRTGRNLRHQVSVNSTMPIKKCLWEEIKSEYAVLLLLNMTLDLLFISKQSDSNREPVESNQIDEPAVSDQNAIDEISRSRVQSGINEGMKRYRWSLHRQHVSFQLI